MFPTEPRAHRLSCMSIRQPLGQSLTFGLLETLGRSIVTGSYEHAHFPTEAELAKRHGVSRSVTREAVKMLTAKGLVSARPKQGTMVQPIASWNLFDTDVLRWMLERKLSLDMLRHCNQLRIAIEPEAAALAAQYGTDANVAAISKALDVMESAATEIVDGMGARIDFHIAVLDASRNPFYSQFKDIVRTALRGSMPLKKDARGEFSSIEAHTAIRNAIVRRNPRAARTAMRRIISDDEFLAKATPTDPTAM